MKLEEEIKQKTFANPFQRLSLNVLFTASWLETQNTRILKPYSLTPQQYNVLRILRGQNQKPVSVGLIQERMIDKSSNASRLIDKLLAKKLVERKICPDDRRQMDIRINQKGLDLLIEIDPIIESTGFEKMITNAEATLIADLLDKMRG
ncbi:MarR family transcriptional regulator [soil metagenome]